ncbi:MAG: hypothetical protein ACRCTZ_07770 [Sarcina sp.]
MKNISGISDKVLNEIGICKNCDNLRLEFLPIEGSGKNTDNGYTCQFELKPLCVHKNIDGDILDCETYKDRVMKIVYVKGQNDFSAVDMEESGELAVIVYEMLRSGIKETESEDESIVRIIDVG